MAITKTHPIKSTLKAAILPFLIQKRATANAIALMNEKENIIAFWFVIRSNRAKQIADLSGMALVTV